MYRTTVGRYMKRKFTFDLPSLLLLLLLLLLYGKTNFNCILITCRKSAGFYYIGYADHKSDSKKFVICTVFVLGTERE
jgi:hypothetical protein